MKAQRCTINLYRTQYLFSKKLLCGDACPYFSPDALARIHFFLASIEGFLSSYTVRVSQDVG